MQEGLCMRKGCYPKNVCILFGCPCYLCTPCVQISASVHGPSTRWIDDGRCSATMAFWFDRKYLWRLGVVSVTHKSRANQWVFTRPRNNGKCLNFTLWCAKSFLLSFLLHLGFFVYVNFQPHQDGPAYFPVVAILSLGNPAVMQFTPHQRLLEMCGDTGNMPVTTHEAVSVVLMPGSLLVFKDAAYQGLSRSDSMKCSNWLRCEGCDGFRFNILQFVWELSR